MDTNNSTFGMRVATFSNTARDEFAFMSNPTISSVSSIGGVGGSGVGTKDLYAISPDKFDL
jgi:hypothetical protein